MRLSFPKELHAVCKPICLALGSDDKFLPKDSIEEFKNWVAQKAPSGSEVHVYPGAPHGEFTVILKHHIMITITELTIGVAVTI